MMRNNYKLNVPYGRMDKRGQLAIFVIIAIVIIAGILITVLMFPNVKERVTGEELSPISYLKDCVEPAVKENVDKLARNAGYSDDEGSALYLGEKYKYLCYTSKYYETCKVQQPLIKQNFEDELKKIVEPKANECLTSLKRAYESRGYDVSSSGTESDVEILPGKIRVSFDTPLTISKETTRNFNGFEVNIESEMYELIFIAHSIIDYESSLGDSETTVYLQYYPNLKIEKIRLSDGTNIYTLSNVVTREEFKFASRSLAWPPGIIG